MTKTNKFILGFTLFLLVFSQVVNPCNEIDSENEFENDGEDDIALLNNNNEDTIEMPQISPAPDAPTGPLPLNGETSVSLNPTISVFVSDPDGDPIDVYFYNADTSGYIGGEFGVSSGGIASCTWSGLSASTTYSWFAVADDDDTLSGIQSAMWSFTTTDGSDNYPDAPTAPSPTGGATSVSLNPTLSVFVYDPNGDPMDVYFYDASDDSLIDVDIAVSSGGLASVKWESLSDFTTYRWYAVAYDVDSISGVQSSTWSFTTLITIPSVSSSNDDSNDDDDNDNDSTPELSIPYGNFYLCFLGVGIVGLIIYKKRRLKS